MGLPGLGRGITSASFHIAGTSALATEWLKRVVRKRMPLGPRCLRWIEVSPSGPTALEALAALMASAVEAGVTMGGFERGLLRWRFFLTLRVDLEEEGVP